MQSLFETLEFPKIVGQCLNGYDRDEAWTAQGQEFGLLTNFPAYQLPLYVKAIREFIRQTGIPDAYTIHNEPYGFNEDQGRHFKILGYSLYCSFEKLPDSSDCSPFWRILDSLKEEGVQC